MAKSGMQYFCIASSARGVRERREGVGMDRFINTKSTVAKETGLTCGVFRSIRVFFCKQRSQQKRDSTRSVAFERHFIARFWKK